MREWSRMMIRKQFEAGVYELHGETIPTFTRKKIKENKCKSSG
jgi:hypothetical protein